MRSDANSLLLSFRSEAEETVLAPSPHPNENSRPQEPLLLVILGPTGSGKSALAIALAERLNGEIVSCDSVAVYRGMEVGTAKPAASDRVRVPHHLLDVTAPDRPYSAGDYARDARAAIAGITARKHLPIIAGGTGLYLRALLEGLFGGPPRDLAVRDRLRATAERRGADYLHRVLARIDPASAARIHVNDVPKVVRAVEVCLASRQAMADAWETGRDTLTGYRVLRIGLNPPRAALYARLNRRAADMFANGLVEETRELASRYGPATQALLSLGYRQAAEYLAGTATLPEAIAAAAQGHRNYAKRQMTWFRREPGVHWIEGFGDDIAEDRVPHMSEGYVVSQALALIAEHEAGVQEVTDVDLSGRVSS